ncbi:MAG: metallophosphoesterase [SAR324 cluster bacterium]|nr:metallophosphoesterase [SAR324 cluster bacterium]
MKVWALSDPHLSFSQDKPMHIFGEHWREHWKKIAQCWKNRVAPEDVVLVTGDISWAWRLKDAMADLDWLHQLPGRHKLMVRGNHDLWWPKSEQEMAGLPSSLLLLTGEAVRVDGEVFCGTGGWLDPQDPYFEPLDDSPFRRELALLERALERAAGMESGNGIHVLIHFPPYTSRGKPTAFDALIHQHPVKTVTFGHFHLEEEWKVTPQGGIAGVHYTLASADYIGFAPVQLPI